MKKKKVPWDDLKVCIIHLLHSCELDKMTYREIADFLNDPIGTVGCQLKKMGLNRKKIKSIVFEDELLKPHIVYCKLLKKIVLPCECSDCFESSEEIRKRFQNDRVKCRSVNARAPNQNINTPLTVNSISPSPN